MITCTRCGTALPDSNFECGHCQLLFFEESAEAAFLADDDEAEAPVVRPEGSGQRWYPYLDKSPAFAGEAAPEEEAQPPVVQPLAEHDHPLVDEAEPPVVTPMPVVAPTSTVAPTSFVRLDDGVQVALTTRLEVLSAPGDTSPVVHALLDIDPVGAPLVDESDGPVAHVILALDVSASMNAPDKYPVLTRALENMLNDLRDAHDGEVLISLIVFAYGAEILLRAEPASTLSAREVLRLIDGSPLRFGRYTDLNGALSRAGRLAYDSHRALPRLPLRVYVLTDGKPQDMDAARETMKLIHKLPVDVNGLAFGVDADVDALQQLISGGRGGTVKQVRADTLSSAFERIAEVARRVIAKRALLDVELRAGVVGGNAYRFRPGRYAYGKRAFGTGTRFSTDLGTLETGRRYSLLFQFRLPPTASSETEVGRITLRLPGEGGPVTFETLVSIPRHAGTDMPAPETAVVEARHIVEAESDADPTAQLKALRARRRLYVEERRDPYIIEIIDRAIDELATRGSLDALSRSDRAALQSHTQSVVTHGTAEAGSDAHSPKAGAFA